MSQQINYPYPENSRGNVEHTLDNRPDCAYPGCAERSKEGKVRKAQNQLGKGKVKWRGYKVDGMVVGGLCVSCNKFKTPGMSNEAIKAKKNQALLRGFVTKDGKPDIDSMNKYDQEEQYKKECEELSSRWGITIELDVYKSHKSTIHRISLKNYCENENNDVEHLEGIHCNYSSTWLPLVEYGIITKGEYLMNLEVDHIDGDSSHEHPDNYRTLCSQCHKIKTFRAGDNISQGRKTIQKRQKKIGVGTLDSHLVA